MENAHRQCGPAGVTAKPKQKLSDPKHKEKHVIKVTITTKITPKQQQQLVKHTRA